MAVNKYFKERDIKNMAVVDECCTTLPSSCVKYFDDISLARAPSTMANYARQLGIFFDWIHMNVIEDKDPKEYDFEDLSKIKSDDIMMFLHELKYSGDSDETLRTYMRSISAFYSHLNKQKLLDVNPVDGIIRPKHKRSPKVYLDNEDLERFTDTVTTGSGLQNNAVKYRETIGSKSRDIAMISMLIDTGIRISELIGLDLKDVDFERCRIAVQRKGGAIDIVYFSDETLEFLNEYIKVREKITDKSEHALFVSNVGKNKGHRLSVRSVELLIKKYATAAGVSNSSKMTPHKLRHTCAMSLLKITGNIALVQKQLGHKNITSTTVYAEADDSDLAAIRNIRKQN